MDLKVALYVLTLCNLLALGGLSIAYARIMRWEKFTKDLDWQAVADITGDIGSIKRSVQKVNNRINGMEKTSGSSDALAELALLHQQNQNSNVTAMPQQQVRGG